MSAAETLHCQYENWSLARSRLSRPETVVTILEWFDWVPKHPSQMYGDCDSRADLNVTLVEHELPNKYTRLARERPSSMSAVSCYIDYCAGLRD